MTAPTASNVAPPRVLALRRLLDDFRAYDQAFYRDRPLRKYQLAAVGQVLDAMPRGDDVLLMFARQGGKDELLARLLAFLIGRLRLLGGEMVFAAPVYKPQLQLAWDRLDRNMRPELHPGYEGAKGYTMKCGRARIWYLSAEPSANIRGPTANRLLVVNEAQDVTTMVMDSRLAPMAATGNASFVLSGTPWTRGSALSRAIQECRRRVVVDWQGVAAELPAYGAHVRKQIAALGPTHPFIRTEYYLEEIDSQGGFLNKARQAQLRGDHPRQRAATAGRSYAILLDVAGADEDVSADPATYAAIKRHDATVATVVEVVLARPGSDDPLPSFRVVDRRAWVGVKHATLYRTLLDLIRTVWRARWVVIDATGVGAGLASFLAAALEPRVRVLPYIFSLQSKSALGWAFLGLIESGRLKEYQDDGDADTRQFWAQADRISYAVDAGPAKTLRWSVPDSETGPDGQPLHDDYVLSLALVAALPSDELRAREFASRTREDYPA